MPSIQDIEKLWNDDCIINPSKLLEESIGIPLLHNKYYSIYIREKLGYTKLKETEKQLEQVLTSFFHKTLTDEELEEYGLVYGHKKYMKSEVPKAVAAHKEMIDHRLKMSLAWEKVEYLKSILQMISSRSFQIRDALESKKIDNGLI